MGQPEIDQCLSSRKFEKTELRTVLFSFFFFIFNSTRINDRRKGKEGGNEWRQEWNNREKRMEPLFSYFNIRDFSLRFLHSCGQSRGGVERWVEEKNRVDGFLMEIPLREARNFRENVSRDGRISSSPSIQIIDINFTDKLIA